MVPLLKSAYYFILSFSLVMETNFDSNKEARIIGCYKRKTVSVSDDILKHFLKWNIASLVESNEGPKGIRRNYKPESLAL